MTTMGVTDEGVAEVFQRNGQLADDEYDEFVFRTFSSPGLEVDKSTTSPTFRSALMA